MKNLLFTLLGVALGSNLAYAGSGTMLGFPFEIGLALIICSLLLTVAAFIFSDKPFMALFAGLFWFASAYAVTDLVITAADGTQASWIMGTPLTYLFGFVGVFMWLISIYNFAFPEKDPPLQYIEYDSD